MEDWLKKTLDNNTLKVIQQGILLKIQQERDRQDTKWGGPSHDDEHSLLDFCRWIRNYTGWAEQQIDAQNHEEAKKRLVQVAALAVAALESLERK